VLVQELLVALLVYSVARVIVSGIDTKKKIVINAPE